MKAVNVCPSCGSRNVTKPKREKMGCIWLVFIFISMGLGLIFWFFTPKYITCKDCGAKWRI